jgi:signal transduction histidine kinase
VLHSQDAFTNLNKEIESLPDSERLNRLVDFTWNNRGKYPDLAIKAGETALHIIDSLHLYTKEPKTLNLLGVIHRNLGHYKEALDYFTDALKSAKKNSDKVQLGYAHNNLGSLHRLLGNGSLAVEQTFKGLEIFHQLNDNEGIAFCALNLGVLYKNQKNYTKSLEYLNLVIEIRRKNKDKQGEITACFQLAEVYCDLKNFEKALSIYNYTIEENEKSKNLVGVASALSGISQIFFQKASYQEALNYKLRSLEINSKISKKIALLNDNWQLALIYAKLNNFLAGREYLDKSFELADSLNSFYFSQDVYLAASEFFSLEKDFQNAFKYSQLAIAMDDSVEALEGLEKSAQIETVYKNEKAEKEAEIAIVQLESSRQLTNFLYFIIIVVLGLLVVLFYAYRQKRTLNKELREINDFKDKLFRVIAHDLKNPFFAVLGYSEMLLDDADSLSEKEKVAYINNIKNATLNNYQLLENLLEWSHSNLKNMQPKIEMVDIFSLSNKAIDLFRHTAKMKSIELKLECDSELKLKTDTNMVYSILRNLLGNSLKFTNRGGVITLRWLQVDQSYRFEIEDNGIGINKITLDDIISNHSINRTKGTEGEGGTGIGLTLVYEFVQKLNGTVEIFSTEEVGTKIVISLPENE